MKVSLPTFQVSCLAFLIHASNAESLYARSSCSSFVAPEGNSSYTKPGDRTFIVSRGTTCTGTSDCYVDVAGYVTDSRTLNITTDASSSIFSVISDSVNITFAESLTGNITTQQWPISNGTSGYVGFTPTHRCTSGKLSGCDDNNLDDVYVEACTPYSTSEEKDSNGFTSLYGSYHEITTTLEEADALTCDPANSTAAVSGITSTNCSAAATSTPSSKSGALRSMVNTVGLAAGIAIAVVGTGLL